MGKKIGARLWGVSLEHSFFDHLSENEIAAIRYEIATDITHVISIERNLKPLAGAIIQITNDCIHIRECGGAFIAYRKELELYCTILARLAGKKYITFKTAKRGVELTARRFHGFHVNEAGELEKEVL